MAQLLPYFDPQTLSKLEGLIVRARGTVEGSVTGAHRSPFHGFAAEFAEHREYAPGDDLRYVDWKVYGRSDKIFVKQFEEETNFACHVLLDASESMTYRSEIAPLSKLEFAKHLAAALSYIIVKQQDAIGLIAFDRDVIRTVHPGSHAAHWKQISNALELTETRDEKRGTREQRRTESRRSELSTLDSQLSTLFADIDERVAHRGVVILLSDLFGDRDSLMLGLKRLRHRKHDVRVWQIIDPAEEAFPFDDPTLFRGLEGWADLSIEPRMLRTAYRREFLTHRESLRHQCRDLSIDFQTLRTDMPVEIAIKKCLALG